VVEGEGLRGMGDDGGGIGSDDVLVLAHADHQRRTFAGYHEYVRFLFADDGDRVRAGDFTEGGLHGCFKIALVQLADEVGEDFRVGFGSEDVAFFDEVGLQGGVIFDDAVVDQGNAMAVGGVVGMGVSIVIGGGAVGGP